MCRAEEDPVCAQLSVRYVPVTRDGEEVAAMQILWHQARFASLPIRPLQLCRTASRCCAPPEDTNLVQNWETRGEVGVDRGVDGVLGPPVGNLCHSNDDDGRGPHWRGYGTRHHDWGDRRANR
ncbi:hypothetical protein ACFPRL_34515 [Pseudoclavibacter helvolus]